MKTSKRWNRVKAPKVWRPEDGDELTGVFIGSQVRNGMYGDYTVYFIRTKNGVLYTSGSMLNDLFSQIGEGEPVKLIFTGMKISGMSGNEYKSFELYCENEVEFRLVG